MAYPYYLSKYVTALGSRLSTLKSSAQSSAGAVPGGEGVWSALRRRLGKRAQGIRQDQAQLAAEAQPEDVEAVPLPVVAEQRAEAIAENTGPSAMTPRRAKQAVAELIRARHPDVQAFVRKMRKHPLLRRLDRKKGTSRRVRLTKLAKVTRSMAAKGDVAAKLLDQMAVFRTRSRR